LRSIELERIEREIKRVVIRSNPASGYGVGDNYPVYFVSWYDAVRFCNALSALIGLEEFYNESTCP
jgi:formylglycine-generating enzyme required for sulfatase activity